MNAASQLFRALAVIGAIAAGVLFYLTNGKIDSLQGQLNRAKSDMSAAQTASAKDLQDAKDQLAANAADTDKAKKDLKAALDNEDLANKRLDGAKQDLDDSEKASKDKDSKLADLTTQVADLKAKADSVDDLNKQISGFQTQIADLQTQLANADTNKNKPAANPNGTAPTATNGPVTPPPPTQLSPAASAKVLQIDTKNWVLVLDVGTDNGVQTGAQLYLKVGDQPIGAVQVADSQAKMAVCRITSTDVMSPEDFAKIVTQGLQVDYQRAL